MEQRQEPQSVLSSALVACNAVRLRFRWPFYWARLSSEESRERVDDYLIRMRPMSPDEVTAVYGVAFDQLLDMVEERAL